MTLADEVDAAERIRELEATNRRLVKRLADKTEKEDEYKRVLFEAVRDAAATIGRLPPIKTPPRLGGKGKPEVALLWTGDWQLGKLTDTYSSDVCERRIRGMAERVVRLTDIQRAAHPVDECHIMFGGDLVEGTSIFPAQSWEIDSGLYEQIFRAAGLVEALVRAMLANFRKVEVWNVYGNHGRIGKKGEYKRSDNADRIVEGIAQGRTCDEPRLIWHASEKWFQTVEVGNYRALLVHGDQVKSWGGNLPVYGIVKKVTAWATGVVPHFHDAYMGHYHQEIAFTLANGGKVYVSPSPESSSEYAAEFVAAKGRPGQRLHFVEPTKGRLTGQYIIDLGGIE